MRSLCGVFVRFGLEWVLDKGKSGEREISGIKFQHGMREKSSKTSGLKIALQPFGIEIEQSTLSILRYLHCFLRASNAVQKKMNRNPTLATDYECAKTREQVGITVARWVKLRVD